MKVIYTGEAIDCLEGILAFIATNYPAKSAAFEKRLRTAVMRIDTWPESAEAVAERQAYESCRSFGIRIKSSVKYSQVSE